MSAKNPSVSTALALHWTLLTISGLFVFTRLWIRLRILARKLEVSDYFILFCYTVLLAAIPMNTFFLANNSKYNQTLDVNILLENQGLIKTILKMSLALTMLYYAMLMSIKAAFLALYFKLATQLSGRIKIVLWATTGFIVLGWIAVELIQLLWCQPISRQFTTDFLNFCTPFYSVQAFTYAYAYNIASDLLVIIFPVLLWRQLKLTKRTEKTGLCFIFFIGSISVAASTARFIIVKSATSNLSDQQTNGTIVSMMSTIEVASGLIAACLPTFRALLSFKKTQHKRSRREESERQSDRNRRKRQSSKLDSTTCDDDVELKAADTFPRAFPGRI